MRKQTKKVLSWVLAGAMALSLIPSVGLVSEKADAAVSTVDKVVFDKAVESKQAEILEKLVCQYLTTGTSMILVNLKESA